MPRSQRSHTDHIDTHAKNQTNPAHKNQAQRNIVEPALDQLMFEQAARSGGMDGQVDLLSNPQFQTAQRQSAAGQIGQAQGNKHLGQVLLAGSGRSIQRVPGGSHRTVRFGSQGADVREAQVKLNSAGATPPLAEDAIFGPLTRAATVEFQTGNGLEPDGVIGPITWGALDAGGTGSGTETTGGETTTTGGETTTTGEEMPIERWSEEDRTRLSNQASSTGPLTEYQASRAELRVLALSEGEYTSLRSLLEEASGDVEWAFLLKAAAAQRTIGDITIFATRIRGMSERWLMRNLMVVDLVNDLDPEANPEETGIRQQYGNSCGPTSVQLLRAQADPIYALELRSAGPIDQASETPLQNPESVQNEQLANEQRDMLQSHVPEGGIPATEEAGPGAWVESDMNALRDATGVSYTTRIIGTDITQAEAMEALREGMASGVHVPIIVGGGLGTSNTSHYVVVLLSAENRFLIHDVATGESVWRTEDEFLTNSLHLPSLWDFFVAIDVPSLVPPPLPEVPEPAGG